MTSAQKKRLPLWLSLAVNVLAALLVVSLCQAFVVKVYRVPSGSMAQTLQDTNGGDRILVNRMAYGGGTPKEGDVVVFTRPAQWKTETPASGSGLLGSAARAFGDLTGIGTSNEQYLVKRVLAVGGDTVSCCDVDGKVLLNGKPLDEPYIYQNLPFEPGVLDCSTTPRSSRCFPSFTVPAGSLVVLGDHRSVSSDSVAACRNQAVAVDSSCIRTVDQSAVVGHVVLRLWPLDRIGPVD